MAPTDQRRLENLLAPVAVVVVVGLVVAFLTLRGEADDPAADGAAAPTPEPSPSAPATATPPRPQAAPSTEDGRAAQGRERSRLPAPLAPLASDLPEPSCRAPMPPVTLTAVTLNITAAPGTERYDLGRLVREIRRWDADVLMLQEVDRFRDRTGRVDQATVLARRLDMELAYAPAAVWPAEPDGGRDGETGGAVLSRFPIVGEGGAGLPGPERLEPRGVLGARLDVRGEPVDVYTTQLEESDGPVRERQARSLTDLVTAQELPTLLGADLGAGPDTAPLRLLTEGPMRDVWTEVGSGAGATVPADDPRNRHDYQLHDGAFRPVSADLLRSQVASHRALRATYDVTTTPACLPPGSVN